MTKNKENCSGCVNNSNKWTYLSPWLALVSSSCCIIQLILNLFSVSCAGFAILNPYRSIFTTLTVISIVYNFYRYGITKQTMITLIISLLLCTSNEMVKFVNEGNLDNPIQVVKQLIIPQQQEETITTIPTTTTTRTIQNYKIVIDGIGCMSCANRIKNTLNSQPSISKAVVFLENSTAIVTTTKPSSSNNPNDDYSHSLEQIINNIDKKYTAKVTDKW